MTSHQKLLNFLLISLLSLANNPLTTALPTTSSTDTFVLPLPLQSQPLSLKTLSHNHYDGDGDGLHAHSRVVADDTHTGHAEHVRQANYATLAKRLPGGVRMCTEERFGGFCWWGVYELNTCVGLGSFTGNIGSFRPDEPTNCFLMQGGCNANAPFASLYHSSEESGQLETYSWIGSAASYICFDDSFLAEGGEGGMGDGGVSQGVSGIETGTETGGELEVGVGGEGDEGGEEADDGDDDEEAEEEGDDDDECDMGEESDDDDE